MKFQPLGELLSERFPKSEQARIISEHYIAPCAHRCQCHNGYWCLQCHGPRLSQGEATGTDVT